MSTAGEKAFRATALRP